MKSNSVIFFKFVFCALISCPVVFATQNPSTLDHLQLLEDITSEYPDIGAKGRGQDIEDLKLYLQGKEGFSAAVTMESTTNWMHALEVYQVRKGKKPAAFFSEEYQKIAGVALWEELLDSKIDHIAYEDEGSKFHLVYSLNLPEPYQEALKKVFVDAKRDPFFTPPNFEKVFYEGMLLGYSLENIVEYSNRIKIKTAFFPDGLKLMRFIP